MSVERTRVDNAVVAFDPPFTLTRGAVRRHESGGVNAPYPRSLAARKPTIAITKITTSAPTQAPALKMSPAISHPASVIVDTINRSNQSKRMDTSPSSTECR